MAIIGVGSITITDLNDVIASATPPTSPQDGNMWFNETDKKLYIYKNGKWEFSAEGMVIGGNNLLKGTKYWSVGRISGILQANKYNDLSVIYKDNSTGTTTTDVARWEGLSIEPNSYYTLSFYARGTGVFHSYFYSDVTQSGKSSEGVTTTATGNGNIAHNLTNDWKRYWITWKTLPTVTGLKNVLPMRLVAGASGYICGVKFEKGNIATDYTPSPDDLEGVVSDVTETLGNMANDSIIDIQERQVIKDKLTDILGYVITDTTTTLPAYTTLDVNNVGGFYNIRKSALNSGIPNTNAKYIDVATKYTALKNYLDPLTPVKAWDVSSANSSKNISVNKTNFRNAWLNYYLALDALITETAQKLKENVDNVTVGGTNYASNGDFSLGLTGVSWSYAYAGQLKEIIDISTQEPPFQYAYHAINTTNANAGIFQPDLWRGDIANSMLGKEITISFWLKYKNITQGTNGWNLGRFGELIIEGERSDGTKVYAYPRAFTNNVEGNSTASSSSYISGTDEVWRKYVVTHKINMPSGGVKLTRIAFKHGLEGCVGELWTTGIKVEIGNRVTDWSPMPKDMDNVIAGMKLNADNVQLYVTSLNTSMEDLSVRLNNVEIIIDEDSIVNSVTSSTTFQNILGSKLDGSDISSFTTQEDLENARLELQEYANNKFEGFNPENFVENSTFEQTVDAFDFNIRKSGGVNMIKNSVGYADKDFWTEVNGSHIEIVNTQELDVLGIGSGFYYPPTTIGRSIYQKINVVVGRTYTLSWMANKNYNAITTEGVDERFLVEVMDETRANSLHMYRYPNNFETDGFEEQSITFEATEPVITIRLYGYKDTDTTITALMLNEGTVPFTWSMATGEIYNSNVKFDLNGIKVISSAYDGYTQITPEEFSGYARVEDEMKKVFTLNNDTTEVTKIKVEQEIAMPPIKIIQLKGGIYNGWAFVKYEED